MQERRRFKQLLTATERPDQEAARLRTQAGNCRMGRNG
jgi:hypothetical protein